MTEYFPYSFYLLTSYLLPIPNYSDSFVSLQMKATFVTKTPPAAEDNPPLPTVTNDKLRV